MAELVVHPDDADCAAWYGWDENPPNNLATWKENVYSSVQKTAVSTDDEESVNADNIGPPPYQHAGHLYQLRVGSPGTISQFDVLVRLFDSGGENGDLEAWNATSSTWEWLSTHTGGGPGAYNLTGQLTTGLSDYLDGNGDLHLVVYNDYESGDGCEVRYVRLTVTYEGTVKSGAAALAGTAAVAAAGGFEREASAALAGTAAVAAAGDSAHFAAASLDGAGTLIAAAKTDPGGVALLQGSGSLAAVAVVLHEAAAALSATATVLAIGDCEPIGIASLAATGTVAAGGETDKHADALLAAAGVLAAAGKIEVPASAELAGSAALACQPLLAHRLYVSVLPDDMRRISWDAVGDAYLVADGQQVALTDRGYADLAASFEVRQFLEALDRLRLPALTPLDRVQLTVAGDADAVHKIYRRPIAGAWSLIAQIRAGGCLDGPLADGTYQYRAVAEDNEGDTAQSGIETATISSAPEPPSGLAYSWNAATKTLTLSWSASPSADLASYRVRSSAGDARLDLGSAPVQDSAALSYVRTFTAETGLYVFSVRAVDSSGKQEANVAQVLALRFLDGSLAAIPADPDMVAAAPAAGGKIRLTWIYRPWRETNGPGAAYQARIYWDNATGAVDFTAPHATVYMGNPTAETSYAWTSAALTDGEEYRFVIRIATAAQPGGIETQNRAEVRATADSDQPTAPVLSVAVV